MKFNFLKKTFFLSLIGITGASISVNAAHGDKVVTSEPFEGKVVTDGLEFPWEMVWGPNKQLWVTERTGKNIRRINPETGESKILYTFNNAFVGPQHEGVLGLALSPEFLSGKGKNYVYTAYTYKNDKDEEFARIVRLTYDKKSDKLTNETVILDKLPGSSDHNSGRLIFGPDKKLYYTIGDQGHNQGKYLDKLIESQRTATAQEVAKKDFSSYPGSTLRLNTDGSIPKDNPVINGVRSHIYTYGHRNAQGLVFVENNLFSTEHGPSSDDELNLLEAAGNYGWPNVAGYKDNLAYEYVNNSDNKKTYKETDFNADNFKEPLKTFFTVKSDYNFKNEKCGKLSYLCWPTIAPSSVTYYPKDGKITAWQNSLLITSLKNGALYRIPLNADGKNIQGDVIKYFKTNNRYRVVLVSPDTKKIYIATDTKGNVIGTDGKPNTEMENKGAILVFEYKE